MTGQTQTTLAIVGSTLAILAALWKGWRVLDRKLVDPFVQLMLDWHGNPGRPEAGIPPMPGMMVRVFNLEQGLRQVHTQVNPNGGGSMYDKVTRIETAVETTATETHGAAAS